MRARLRRWTLLGCAFVAGFAAGTGAPQHALADSQSEQQRLDELKAMKRDMLRMMRQYEGRIAKLEAEMKEERAIAKREAAQALAAAAKQRIAAASAQAAGLDDNTSSAAATNASAAPAVSEGLSNML